MGKRQPTPFVGQGCQNWKLQLCVVALIWNSFVQLNRSETCQATEPGEMLSSVNSCCCCLRCHFLVLKTEDDWGRLTEKFYDMAGWLAAVRTSLNFFSLLQPSQRNRNWTQQTGFPNSNKINGIKFCTFSFFEKFIFCLSKHESFFFLSGN